MPAATQSPALLEQGSLTAQNRVQASEGGPTPRNKPSSSTDGANKPGWHRQPPHTGGQVSPGTPTHSSGVDDALLPALDTKILTPVFAV